MKHFLVGGFARIRAVGRRLAFARSLGDFGYVRVTRFSPCENASQRCFFLGAARALDITTHPRYNIYPKFAKRGAAEEDATECDTFWVSEVGVAGSAV